jgi:hypothetical protein
MIEGHGRHSYRSCTTIFKHASWLGGQVVRTVIHGIHIKVGLVTYKLNQKLSYGARADSKFGALRASLGHADPWQLNYVGIGNENCGRPDYATNFAAFRSAITAVYPHMQVIANCDLSSLTAADLFDLHWCVM